MFRIKIEKKADKFLRKLPPKSRRIVAEKISELKDNPFPGGNREKLELPFEPPVYRLHVSRSFTVFYIIDTDENVIRIDQINTIEKAHNNYSRR
jgi:mRNA interferase RelE/StbE